MPVHGYQADMWERAFIARLLLGLTLAALLGWWFVEIGEELSGSFIHSIDSTIIGLVEHYYEDQATGTMRVVTFFGSWVTFAIFGVAAIVGLSLRRRYADAVMIAIVLFGGLAIVLFLKSVYHRPRPEMMQLTYAVGYSFPSGHSLVSACFYGFVAYLASLNWRWYAKGLLWIFTVVVVITIGFSRVYLGVHWPTDVLAGFIAGSAWLIACISARCVLLQIGARRRRPQDPRPR